MSTRINVNWLSSDDPRYAAFRPLTAADRSNLFRIDLIDAASNCLEDGMNLALPCDQALLVLCKAIEQLLGGRLTPAEVMRSIHPVVVAAAPPSQAEPDVITDPGSLPFFDR